VEVEGRVGSNGCAPQVRADTLVVIGQAPLPPALPIDLNALFDSRRIFQRVEVEGVVQGVEYRKNTPTTVYLGAGGLRLPVRVCRRVGGGEPPEPVRLGEPQLLAPHGLFRATQWPTSMGLYDGRLIRCRAVVAAPLPDSARGLAVTLGRHDCPRAELVFDEPLPLETERRLPRDTEIDVAGIVQIDLVASPLASIGRGLPMIGQVRLLVRRPEDEAAIRERSLIAADLHDTLLQTLTAIGYQLHVCRNATDKSPDHLAVAARRGAHHPR
jgi:hypothetical protein